MKHAFCAIFIFQTRSRARQGLIIYVPEGSDEDPSRNKDYYDRTYQYLKRTGMEEI